MGVDQIKHHPFFYGVNWTIIRDIEAPFVPRLRSITDTSYFPTEELEQVPEEPAGGDTSGANKDLAFLGYVIFRKFPSFIHPLLPGFCYFLLLFPLSVPFHLPIYRDSLRALFLFCLHPSFPFFFEFGSSEFKTDVFS